MRLKQATGAVRGSVRAPQRERAGGGLLHLDGEASRIGGRTCWSAGPNVKRAAAAASRASLS